MPAKNTAVEFSFIKLYLKTMTNPRVFLNKKEENDILQGFPWVFDNEIAFVKAMNGDKLEQTPLADCKVKDGTLVEVYTKGGLCLGSGIINRKSKICVRLLTNKPTPQGIQFFNKEYFAALIEQALQMRLYTFSAEDSFRLIFGEADFIPGLIVERYCDISGKVFLVVQFLTLGVEVFRLPVLQALEEVCKPAGIYERSDANVRLLEGLELRNGWLSEEFDPCITIKENGVLLKVDLAGGQKTGYFLDQKMNRRIAASYAKDAKVLDTFTHTGAFGLNCFLAGAKSVLSVDISEDACKTVQANIELNNAQNVMNVRCADVFDLLKECEQQKEQFDLIILDPPAFTKSAKAVEKAYGGYKEINLRAMKILKKGGILITCSCSHFFDSNMFYGMIHNAAVDAKRRVQILEKRGAGADHPVLMGYPKSDYLKCAVLRVL